MSLAVQYALVETNDIDESCREIVEMYLGEIPQINKHEFEIKEDKLEESMEDMVIELTENNIEDLRSYNPNIVDIGYFRLDNVREEDKKDIVVDKIKVDREWDERYIIRDKETNEEIAVKDTIDVAINYCEYKAKKNNKDYEIHIEQYDKYNTSLEVEVKYTNKNKDEDNKVVVLFWLTDTDFTLDDDLDLGSF